MEIRHYTDLAHPELASAWEELESAGACPSLFASRTWVETWAASFAEGMKAEVFVGYGGGEPVGLAPLFSRGRDVVFPVNFLSPRGEFVLSRGADEFAALVLGRLRARRLTLKLRGVPADSLTITALRKAAPSSGYLIVERASRVSPFIDTSGTWEDYYASRRRKATHEWERKMRKLDGAGAVRFVRFESGMDVDRLVDDFIAVESRSWKERGGTSIAARGAARFYHDLSRALADRGTLLPFWLELDGEMIAFLLGAVHDNVYHAMKTSYDETFSRLSPGTRLFYEAVRHAFGAGFARFDFLGERARWKDEWATGWREHTNLMLFPNTLSGRSACFVESVLKPVARRIRDTRREN